MNSEMDALQNTCDNIQEINTLKIEFIMNPEPKKR